METWIKESARWLFTFLSLFLRHQVAEAFIISAANAPLLQADGEEWTPSKQRRKQFLKPGAGEQSAEPPPWFPGTGTWSSARVLSRVFWVNPRGPPTFSPCAVCTWAAQDVNKHVRDRVGCQKKSPSSRTMTTTAALVPSQYLIAPGESWEQFPHFIQTMATAHFVCCSKGFPHSQTLSARFAKCVLTKTRLMVKMTRCC